MPLDGQTLEQSPEIDPAMFKAKDQSALLNELIPFFRENAKAYQQSGPATRKDGIVTYTFRVEFETKKEAETASAELQDMGFSAKLVSENILEIEARFETKD